MILALKILTGCSKITVPSFTWELPMMQMASKPETTVAKQGSASLEECKSEDFLEAAGNSNWELAMLLDEVSLA